MMMAAGGGQLVQSYRGGIGKYWRLENNTLVGKPIAITYGEGNDDIEKAYPAAIVRTRESDDELVALSNHTLVKLYEPELYQKCEGSSMINLMNSLMAHEQRSRKAKQRQKLRKAA